MARQYTDHHSMFQKTARHWAAAFAGAKHKFAEFDSALKERGFQCCLGFSHVARYGCTLWLRFAKYDHRLNAEKCEKMFNNCQEALNSSISPETGRHGSRGACRESRPILLRLGDHQGHGTPLQLIKSKTKFTGKVVAKFPGDYPDLGGVVRHFMEHIPPMQTTSYPSCPVSGLCEQEEKDSAVLN